MMKMSERFRACPSPTTEIQTLLQHVCQKKGWCNNFLWPYQICQQMVLNQRGETDIVRGYWRTTMEWGHTMLAYLRSRSPNVIYQLCDPQLMLLALAGLKLWDNDLCPSVGIHQIPTFQSIVMTTLPAVVEIFQSGRKQSTDRSTDQPTLPSHEPWS